MIDEFEERRRQRVGGGGASCRWSLGRWVAGNAANGSKSNADSNFFLAFFGPFFRRVRRTRRTDQTRPDQTRQDIRRRGIGLPITYYPTSPPRRRPTSAPAAAGLADRLTHSGPRCFHPPILPSTQSASARLPACPSIRLLSLCPCLQLHPDNPSLHNLSLLLLLALCHALHRLLLPRHVAVRHLMACPLPAACPFHPACTLVAGFLCARPALLRRKRSLVPCGEPRRS